MPRHGLPPVFSQAFSLDFRASTIPTQGCAERRLDFPDGAEARSPRLDGQSQGLRFAPATGAARAFLPYLSSQRRATYRLAHCQAASAPSSHVPRGERSMTVLGGRSLSPTPSGAAAHPPDDHQLLIRRREMPGDLANRSARRGSTLQSGQKSAGPRVATPGPHARGRPPVDPPGRGGRFSIHARARARPQGIGNATWPQGRQLALRRLHPAAALPTATPPRSTRTPRTSTRSIPSCRRWKRWAARSTPVPTFAACWNRR